MTKVLAIIGLLFALLAAIVLSDRALPDADLTMINRTEFLTLDPQKMSYNHDLRLSYAIYEPLVRWDNMSEGFDIVPAAATHWDISDDYLTYTFYIAQDAKWSNGDPLTAHDYRFSWRRALFPDTGAYYSEFFFFIEGGSAFFDWRTAQLEEYAMRPEDERTVAAAEQLYNEALEHFDNTVGLKALDDKTLQITLERPTAFFLDICAFGVLNPAHPPSVKANMRFDRFSARVQVDSNWTKPPNLVTNGPYTPVSWRYKREMFLERNAHYHRPENVNSDTIKILPAPDPNTAVLMFETGAADWHTDVTVAYVADMLNKKAQGQYENIHAFSTFGTYYWDINCRPFLADGRRNPLADPQVRRALVMAVDKVKITEQVKRSGEKPATVFVPPNSIPGFDSPPGLQFDPEAARAELQAAGWWDRNNDGVIRNADGEPFPTIEMLYSTGSYHQDIALAIGADWKAHLGLDTTLDGKELKVYRDERKAGNFMVARGGWFGDYGDPTTFLDLHRTGNPNNDPGYADPVLDALLDRARDTADPEARMRLLEEAERYTMMETLPILPIWHYNYYYMYRPPYDEDGLPNAGGLRGISKHPRLVQYFWQLEVITEEEAQEARRASRIANAPAKSAGATQ